MGALIRKELSLYFNNLSGVLISGLFLLITGLFLWVIPGSWNVFSVGYANINGLFELAPWLYLFLIPAISMRLFADEYRIGTIELLMTSPLSSSKVVFSKFIAGFIVVLVSLLPTLVFVYSINMMASPMGNIDSGAIIGSYIGLLFLACLYLAIGVFASSLTDNQIVAFLFALVLCYLVYAGLDFVSLIFSGQLAFYISQGGISSHYEALSRGVVELSDVVYFVSMTLFFLFLTQKKIER